MLLPHEDLIDDFLDPAVHWPSVKQAVEYHLGRLVRRERKQKTMAELEAARMCVLEQSDRA